MTYLHGQSPDASPEASATRQAGHDVMEWLLDFPGQPTKMTLHQSLLSALAGIVAEGNRDLLGDLLENLNNPDYFSRQTDAFLVATAAALLDDRERQDFLIGAILATSELFLQFDPALRQMRQTILRDGTLSKQALRDLGRQWDALFQLGDRPKSDLVYRALARQLEWDLPKDCLLGWDLKPIA